MKLLNM